MEGESSLSLKKWPLYNAVTNPNSIATQQLKLFVSEVWRKSSAFASVFCLKNCMQVSIGVSGAIFPSSDEALRMSNFDESCKSSYLFYFSLSFSKFLVCTQFYFQKSFIFGSTQIFSGTLFFSTVVGALRNFIFRSWSRLVQIINSKW